MSATVEPRFRWPGDTVQDEISRLERELASANDRALAAGKRLDEAVRERDALDAKLDRALAELKGEPLQPGRAGS